MKATDEPIESIDVVSVHDTGLASCDDMSMSTSDHSSAEALPGSPVAIFSQLDSQPLPTGQSLSLANQDSLELDLDEPVDPMLGTVIGNFRILEVIGTGGFGKVYRAVHTMLGESFAVKLLKVATQSNKEFVKRFQREARVLAQLKHDNVVNLADFGLLPDGGLYIIMEYLQGASLQQRLRAREPFPLPRMIHLMRQMCDVLGYIHRKGVIHRDLKPGNIFLVPDEEGHEKLKLIDFGIAALHEESSEPLTQTEAFLGTAKYASPEQIIGEDELDHRSDLYALGVLLYRLVAGRLPFRGKGVMSIINQQLNNAPPALGTLFPGRYWSPKLESFIQMALAKRREERPQSAQVFGDICCDALSEQLEIDRSEGQAHTGVFLRQPPRTSGGDQSSSYSSPSRGLVPPTRSASMSRSQMSASEQRRIREAQRLAELSGSHQRSSQDVSLGLGTPTSVPPATNDLPELFADEADPKPSSQLLRPSSSSVSSGHLMPLLDEPSPHSSTYTPATTSIQVTGQHPTSMGGGFWFRLVALIILGSLCGYGVLYAVSQWLKPKPPNTVLAVDVGNRAKTGVLPAVPRLRSVKQKPRAVAPTPRLHAARTAPAGRRPAARRKAVIRPRSATRRRSPARRRRKRRRYARVVRPRTKVGPCGAPAKGARYVYALLQQPKGGRASVRFLGCSGCRVKRKSGGVCLQIPKAMSRVKLSVIVEGYQPCLHTLSGKASRVRWRLREDDPGGLAVSHYQCAWTSP